MLFLRYGKIWKNYFLLNLQLDKDEFFVFVLVQEFDINPDLHVLFLYFKKSMHVF